MTGFIKDVHFAIRQLIARPAFAAIAVLVLALGLGATAAIFSVVNAVLLQPPPYSHPETLVSVFEGDVVGNSAEDAFNVVSPGLFQEWQAHARSVSPLSAVHETSFNISSKSDSFSPERIDGIACSSTFPAVLGVQTILGRFFNNKEDQFEAPRVAVLSYPFWKQHFGGSPNVIGQQIRLDKNNYTILGVFPKGFVYPGPSADVFVPFKRTLDRSNQTSFSNHFFNVIGRLAPGYSVASARSELGSIVQNVRRTHPEDIMASLLPFFHLMFT